MTQALDPSSLPLSAVPPASSSLEVVGEDDIRFARGPRAYRVRGLARNLSAEVLKGT